MVQFVVLLAHDMGNVACVWSARTVAVEDHGVHNG
jgi:hypothetical protein